MSVFACGYGVLLILLAMSYFSTDRLCGLRYLVVVSDECTAECLRIHVQGCVSDSYMVGWLEDVESVRGYDCYEGVDLIISDVMLDDGNTLDAFRCRGVRVPIIFFGDQEADYYDTSGLNVADFLLKPPARNELSRAISAVLKSTISNNAAKAAINEFII